MVVRRLSELEQVPEWAPSFARETWELARSGAEPGLEEEAQALTDLDHPEFAPLREVGDDVPTDFRVEGVNPRLHMMLHRIIEQQLITGDPPEARTAMAHLLALGVDRHEAVHLMMEGLLKDIRTALQHEMPSGYAPFLKRLSQARVAGYAPRATVGRNDPCPCGSGKKHKKCCGAEGSGPILDLRTATMLLGEGMYTDTDVRGLPPSHPLAALENLGAVAHAAAEAGAVTVARQAYRQLAAMVESFDEPVRSVVLKECLEFAATNPE